VKLDDPATLDGLGDAVDLYQLLLEITVGTADLLVLLPSLNAYA
jgi:hypothetical protein